MAEQQVTTTDAEIDAALQRARLHDQDPRAVGVEHIPHLNLLIVHLNNALRLVLALENLQGLEHATAKELKDYDLLGGGTGIAFPALDVDLYVPALVEGVYGNRRWMARLGRKGGTAKSSAKRRAAQANGAKGGRPRKAAVQSE